MRTLIAPLAVALALTLAPALLAGPTLCAEDKKDDKKEAEKPPTPIGEITLNGTVFTVALEGELKAGKEVEIKVVPKGGALPAGTIRGWIGVESGKGSAKGKAHKEDDGVCVHCDAPDPIPADAKIWIELETDNAKAKAGLGIPK
jgi:hypothetical protein